MTPKMSTVRRQGSYRKSCHVLITLIILFSHQNFKISLLQPARAQLSKANEPCISDSDCVEGWEICVERPTKADSNLSIEQQADDSGEVADTAQQNDSEYVCEHKD